MNRITIAACLLLAAPVFAQSTLVPFMPGTVSREKNEYNLSVSDDGRMMVFARSEADFARAKIMVSERSFDAGSANWARPRPISFSDERYRDSDPWLTPDGRTLYFVSDRPTATRPDKRDLDIWRSVKRHGRWQAPEHLGDTVNGLGEELGPELHDSTLYFATARKSGMGGLDIYSSTRTQDGFAKPELLPAPINSAASESDFTISRDGNTALFWRQVGERGLIHVARRNEDGIWSEPEPLPDAANPGSFNFTPAFSVDGTRVNFASNAARPGQPAGMSDVYDIRLAGLHRPKAEGRQPVTRPLPSTGSTYAAAAVPALAHGELGFRSLSKTPAGIAVPSIIEVAR